MTKPVHDFSEFIAEAVASLRAPLAADDPMFISGESLAEAVTRWWGEVMQLEVVKADCFEWRCTGCEQRVRLRGKPIYTLPLFDYALWEHCPICGPLMAGVAN